MTFDSRRLDSQCNRGRGGGFRDGWTRSHVDRRAASRPTDDMSSRQQQCIPTCLALRTIRHAGLVREGKYVEIRHASCRASLMLCLEPGHRISLALIPGQLQRLRKERHSDERIGNAATVSSRRGPILFLFSRHLALVPTTASRTKPPRHIRALTPLTTAQHACHRPFCHAPWTPAPRLLRKPPVMPALIACCGSIEPICTAYTEPWTGSTHA